MLYLEAAAESGEEVYARQAALAKMALAKAALEQEQYHHAASMYRQSAELYQDPRAHSSAGQIAGKLEDWQAARRDFEAALDLPGVDASTHMRLAEVLYSLGETERAIERVELGLAAGADPAEGERLLTRFRREVAVEENFARGGTLHFAITFENVDEQRGFLERVETSLERVYSRVCRELGLYPSNRVPVVVYPSATTYREASGAPTWTAAVYNGKIRVPSGDLAEAPDEHLDRLLAHEFSHYLIERLAGTRAPAWLQEGLAQHVEADGEAPAWIPGFTRRLLRSYRGKPMPFTTKQLEGSFHGMEALKDGTAAEDALYQEMYLTYDKLDERWVSYAKQQLGL
jgi:tetratricopeptide (TPR) repeat protein